LFNNVLFILFVVIREQKCSSYIDITKAKACVSRSIVLTGKCWGHRRGLFSGW